MDRALPRLAFARMHATGVLAATFVLGGSACLVAPVDLTGRACPCVEGWVCDPATDTCQLPGDAPADASGASTPSTDGGESSTSEVASTSSVGGDTSAIPAAFEILEFSADWATPNAIHWAWQVQGQADDFHAWEVRVATSADALDTDAALVFDGTINPELDRYVLRNTQDEEPVEGTITDGLAMATEYFARLHVLDTAGGRAVSPNVAVRSTGLPPTDAEAIFADAFPFPPGVARPEGCYVHTDTAPAGTSTHHFSLQHFCTGDQVATCFEEPGAEPECWENLRLQNMEVAVTGLNVGDFPDAYLEVQIAVDPPPGVAGHGWWSELSLDAGDAIWKYDGLTIRADGEYRRYQIPLTELGLSHEAFASLAQGIRVGSTWSHGSTIRVDEAWIRW